MLFALFSFFNKREILSALFSLFNKGKCYLRYVFIIVLFDLGSQEKS